MSAASSSVRNVSANFQNRLSRTGFEQVPRATNGLQVNGVFRIGFDLFPQTPDVYVHAARSHETVGAPYGIQKLIPRENTVRTRSKIIEQPEFKRTQRHRLARVAHAIRRRING